MPWQKVNPALLAPDTIYIQDPYDGENPCLTIPPMYYAGNLRKYTKNLIYVPSYKVKEFGAEDTTDRYNMKHYVTAPALMYADQIYVQSENMRQRYLECLVEFSGEAYRAIWERKISVSEFVFQSEAGKGTSQKTILYCIGETELANLGKRALAHVESRLQIFDENLVKNFLYNCKKKRPAIACRPFRFTPCPKIRTVSEPTEPPEKPETES